MSSVSRKAIGVVAAVFLVSGLVMSGAVAASAEPGNCTKTLSSDGVGRGQCTSGTGQFRVGIPCIAIFGFTQYSAWVNLGQIAQVGCPFPSMLWTTISGGPQVLLEKRN